MEKTIPTKINKYNVYNDTERLLGMGDEVTLPDFEAMSDTISGAGIMGEIEDPTVGHFGNQEMEIPFRVVDQEAVDMLNMTKAVHLTLRSAQQNNDVLGAILLSELLDSLLIFQIHCTSGGSDEALRRGKDDLGAGGLGAGLDGHTGDAVAVTDDDDLLTG